MTPSLLGNASFQMQKKGRPALGAKDLVAIFLIGAATVLAVIQLTIGSYLLISLLVWLMSIISSSFLLRYDVKVSDIFVFLLGLYSGTFTPFFKTLLGQTLQTNLMLPNESASYLFIGFCSVAICSVVAGAIVGQKSSKISLRLNTLVSEQGSSLVVPLVLVGIVTRFGFIILTKGQAEGAPTPPLAAYLNLFHPIYIFAILLAAMNAARGSAIARLSLVACIVASFIFTIIGNVKVEIISLAICLFFSVLFLGYVIKIKHLVVGAFVMLVSVGFLAPAVQIMRVSLTQIPPSERINALWDIIESANFSPTRLSQLQGSLFTGYKYSYAEYASYVYPSTANIDRFMLLLPVDQVSRSLQNPSDVGLQDVMSEIAELVLPSLLIAKDPEALVDLIAWDRGIRANGSIARPVLGLAATTLSIGGFPALVLLPFLSVLPFMICANYFFGRVSGCVFGVLGCYNMALFPEKEFDKFYGYLLRDLPLQWLTFLLLFLIFRALTRRGSPSNIKWNER